MSAGGRPARAFPAAELRHPKPRPEAPVVDEEAAALLRQLVATLAELFEAAPVERVRRPAKPAQRRRRPRVRVGGEPSEAFMREWAAWRARQAG